MSIDLLALAGPGDVALLERLRLALVANFWSLVAVAVVTLTLAVVSRYLDRLRDRQSITLFRRHTIMLTLCFFGLLIVIMTFEGDMRDDLLKLFGVLLSAAIAFSSATAIGNAMSGLMLRAQRHFRSGDYIEVGEHYGGVVERGLFFTEIQNELRDRVTLPNSYLTSHPVTVIRPEGTLIEADVSLGYDVSHSVIEPLLIEAAGAAGLADPCFVELRSLGDFSVTYRVFGLYKGRLKDLPIARSELRARMLDTLHSGGVEIVSPTFMNQRALASGQVFVPEVETPPTSGSKRQAGRTRFDEAEEAGSAERWSDLVSEYDDSIESLSAEIAEASDEVEADRLRADLEKVERKREVLAERIKQREEESNAE